MTTESRIEATARAKSVASIIIGQLGGSKFIAMTGASSFSSGYYAEGPGLGMRLPRTPKGKYQGMRIVLMPSDTYKVVFLKQTGSFAKGNWKMEEIVIDDVYADGLRELFTSQTGLETSL